MIYDTVIVESFCGWPQGLKKTSLKIIPIVSETSHPKTQSHSFSLFAEPCRRLMAFPLERSFHRRLFQRQSLLLGNAAPVQVLPTITCRVRRFAPPIVVLYTKMSERSGQPLKKMVYILSILYFSGQILIKHSPTWNVTQSCTKYGKAKSELGHALGNSTSLTRCQQVSGVKKNMQIRSNQPTWDWVA